MGRLIAIAVVLALFSLSSQSAKAASTLDKINESGTIRIGFRPSLPPMSFLDQSDQPAGYSIDLCKKIVTSVKTKLGNKDIAVEYVPVTSADRFEALTGNRIDILCGATTKTLERAELVDFTQLIFATGGSLLSTASTPIANVSDLNGKKVAVVKDTTTHTALKHALEQALSDTEVVVFDSSDEGVEALIKGDVAAFAADQIVLVGLVIVSEDRSKFVISRELFSYEPLALSVRRDDADFRLIADRVLSQVYRTGEIGSIYRKWFGVLGDRMPPLVEALYRLQATPE